MYQDVDKLRAVSTDFSKLSNVVDNDVVKKVVYDKLVAKINAIDTSGFVLKIQYNIDESGLEKKIDDADKYLELVYFLKNQIYNVKNNSNKKNNRL